MDASTSFVQENRRKRRLSDFIIIMTTYTWLLHALRHFHACLPLLYVSRDSV